MRNGKHVPTYDEVGTCNGINRHRPATCFGCRFKFHDASISAFPLCRLKKTTDCKTPVAIRICSDFKPIELNRKPFLPPGFVFDEPERPIESGQLIRIKKKPFLTRLIETLKK